MLNKFKITILTAALLIFAGADISMAGPRGGNGNDNGNGNNGGNGGGGGSEPINITPDEVDGLLYMREEEKLARDSYIILGDLWGLLIFDNIAESEQRHMDALKKLIVKYDLVDPVDDEDVLGGFDNDDLQALFEDLMESGDDSVMSALYVGATIEETDIQDIYKAIELAEQADIISTYESLVCGSRNHLRAFVKQIEFHGVIYEPIILSEEEYLAIIEGEVERDCGTSKGPGGNKGPKR